MSFSQLIEFNIYERASQSLWKMGLKHEFILLFFFWNPHVVFHSTYFLGEVWSPPLYNMYSFQPHQGIINILKEHNAAFIYVDIP